MKAREYRGDNRSGSIPHPRKPESENTRLRSFGGLNEQDSNVSFGFKILIGPDLDPNFNPQWVEEN